MTLTTFESSDEFYAARGGRQSEECDFGCWWRASNGPPLRVSVVHETGDVYAITPRQNHRVIVILLGTLRASGRRHCDKCHAHLCPYLQAESRLSGWWELPHDERTLDWVMERLI